ncbi:MAG: hypothetical protein PHQ28_00690 [Mycobacterium sp.]|nr:hypothetical protein [Mycobacterium sp.]
MGTVIRAYTSWIRQGITCGGIQWAALMNTLRAMRDCGEVRAMNDADDWVVFRRNDLGVKNNGQH